MQTSFHPISAHELIKCLRMNRADSGRVSPSSPTRTSLPKAPREISKCRHHRTFFNLLTLNDFIRKRMCTVSVYVWGQAE